MQRFFDKQLSPVQSSSELRLHERYQLELTSVDLLDMTDPQGNPLTLYQSDYEILIAYLTKEGISGFTQLETLEKLNHIEKAKVRLTRFFSPQNLTNYELDVQSTTESLSSDILSTGGTVLCKDGQQNCVVVFNGHLYIHPKIRAISGPVYHELMQDSVIDPNIKNGTIGVYHSSLSQGHPVSFAGSIVFDKDLGWVLENTSGHYFPSADQIKILLRTLEENGMDLSKFMVRLFTLKEPGTIAPDFSEAYFHIHIENAADYMKPFSHGLTNSIK